MQKSEDEELATNPEDVVQKCQSIKNPDRCEYATALIDCIQNYRESKEYSKPYDKLRHPAF